MLSAGVWVTSITAAPPPAGRFITLSFYSIFTSLLNINLELCGTNLPNDSFKQIFMDDLFCQQQETRWSEILSYSSGYDKVVLVNLCLEKHLARVDGDWNYLNRLTQAVAMRCICSEQRRLSDAADRAQERQMVTLGGTAQSSARSARDSIIR